MAISIAQIRKYFLLELPSINLRKNNTISPITQSQKSYQILFYLQLPLKILIHIIHTRHFHIICITMFIFTSSFSFTNTLHQSNLLTKNISKNTTNPSIHNGITTFQ